MWIANFNMHSKNSPEHQRPQIKDHIFYPPQAEVTEPETVNPCTALLVKARTSNSKSFD